MSARVEKFLEENIEKLLIEKVDSGEADVLSPDFGKIVQKVTGDALKNAFEKFIPEAQKQSGVVVELSGENYIRAIINEMAKTAKQIDLTGMINEDENFFDCLKGFADTVKIKYNIGFLEAGIVIGGFNFEPKEDLGKLSKLFKQIITKALMSNFEQENKFTNLNNLELQQVNMVVESITAMIDIRFKENEDGVVNVIDRIGNIVQVVGLSDKVSLKNIEVFITNKDEVVNEIRSYEKFANEEFNKQEDVKVSNSIAKLFRK